MANLYYNAAVNTEWDTLGNWWNDDAFTSPATALPATGDTVYLSSQMDIGPSTSVTLNHIYVTGSYLVVFFTGAIGDATFNGGGRNNGTVEGNATFNGSGSVEYNSGIVTGDATFNDYTRNDGTVEGNATFNDYGYNMDTVEGDATFNGSGGNGATVEGGATFNDYTVNEGAVNGDATFNDNSYNPLGIVSGDATFNYLTATNGTVTDITGYANGIVTGTSRDSVGATITNWVFNGYSVNYGTVSGDATFNHNSCNGEYGTVMEDATFNDNTINYGVVLGEATFNGNSYNMGDIYLNGIYYLGGQPTAILYFTNTGGDAQWLTLSNWQNQNGDSPKEVPWTGRLTSSVNLELSPGAPVPQLNGLLLGAKRIIMATCDNRIAEEIIHNGFNILEPLVYHNNQ